MVIQSENKIDNTQYEPNWQTWENIQKQHIGKYLILGCDKKDLLDNVKCDVIFVSDTDEEGTEFWLKNKKSISDKKLYACFAFRYIPIKRSNTRKAIVSVKKIVKK